MAAVFFTLDDYPPERWGRWDWKVTSFCFRTLGVVLGYFLKIFKLLFRGVWPAPDLIFVPFFGAKNQCFL